MSYRYEIQWLDNAGYHLLDTQTGVQIVEDLGGVKALASLNLLNSYSIGIAPLIAAPISQSTPTTMGGSWMEYYATLPGATPLSGGVGMVSPVQAPQFDLSEWFKQIFPNNVFNGTGDTGLNALGGGDGLLNGLFPNLGNATPSPDQGSKEGGFFDGITLEKIGIGGILIAGLLVANNLTKK